LEYDRDGWTFHSKGIWAQAGSTLLTFIGSSNYSRRSLNRDAEMNLLLLTQDQTLSRDFVEERDRIFSFGHAVDAQTWKEPDRRLPLPNRLLEPLWSEVL
jgi:CDP-diacylglycerol--glycerol-3-phosphate 3-phosphatidyltransferase